MEKDFSIVIPVFNEEESLQELMDSIKKAFAENKSTFEVIFIDDGSTDKTLEILKNIAAKNRMVRICSFRRNLGKSSALMLGFQKAHGKYVVTLDADLQDDPSNIVRLYQSLAGGSFDLVTGWRKERRDGVIKKLSSQIFNKTVSLLFGLKLNDLNSGLKIYKNETAKDLSLYGGMHRFIPVIAYGMGYAVSETPTTHHSRKYGKSKYKFTKIFTDIPDLITIYFLTKYNRRPLHFFGKMGSIALFAGLSIIVYLSYLHFQGQAIGDRPLLIFGTLLIIAGIQTVFTGLIADLLVNFYTKDGFEFPIKYESD